MLHILQKYYKLVLGKMFDLMNQREKMMVKGKTINIFLIDGDQKNYEF